MIDAHTYLLGGVTQYLKDCPLVTGQAILGAGVTQADLQVYLGANHALPVGRRLLVRADLNQTAIVDWLVRHQYRLNDAPAIEAAFFANGFGQGMNNTIIDYLMEENNTRSRVAFHPDPAYQQHIISEP